MIFRDPPPGELNPIDGLPVVGAYYYDRVEKYYVRVTELSLGVDYEEDEHILVCYRKLHPDNGLPIGSTMTRSVSSWVKPSRYANSPFLVFRFRPAEPWICPTAESSSPLLITEDHEIG